LARYREDTASSQLSGGEIYRVADDGSKYSFSYQSSIAKQFKSGWDTVHTGPPFVDESNLDLSHTTVESRTRVNVFGSKTGRRRCNNYDPRVFNTLSHMDKLGPIGVQAYVNQALERLNPNKPIVDVPLFLFELREFPRLLRDAGRFIRQPQGANPGSVYLSYQFGWRPLFGDLYKLLNLVDEIERQKEHLDRAIRRKSASGKLDSVSSKWTSGNFLFRINPYEDIRFYDSWEGTREVWFSAKIEPDFSAPYFGESRTEEIRRVLGLGMSASTVWDAIPWSWLIDYFISVGSYLGASRGVLPFSVSNMNIMATDVVKVTQEFNWSNFESFTFKPGTKKTVRKRRWVYPVPKQRIAFRSNPIAGKTAILSSLFVSRFRR